MLKSFLRSERKTSIAIKSNFLKVDYKLLKLNAEATFGGGGGGGSAEGGIVIVLLLCYLFEIFPLFIKIKKKPKIFNIKDYEVKDD
jgi:hypothetical protein